MSDSQSLDKQAWRKRPRRFAPKRKTGCRTCKVRRIKCDEGKPKCRNCTSTGRTCDGYSPPDPLLIGAAATAAAAATTVAEPADIDPRAAQFKYQQSRVVPRHAGRHVLAQSVASHDGRWQVSSQRCHAPPVVYTSPGSLLFLPTASPDEGVALDFFKVRTLAVLALGDSKEKTVWSRVLAQFIGTKRSVQHAAIALASLHRPFSQGQEEAGRKIPRTAPSFVPHEFALRHYNQAIHCLLEEAGGGSNFDYDMATATALVTCILLTSFECLSVNYDRMIFHYRNGVRLLEEARLKIHDRSGNLNHPDRREILEQVASQFRRLDLHGLNFYSKKMPMLPHYTRDLWWRETPANNPENPRPLTIGDAKNALHHLMAETAVFKQRELRAVYESPGPSKTARDAHKKALDLLEVERSAYLDALERWPLMFASVLNPPQGHLDVETARNSCYLQMNQKLVYINLAVGEVGDELKWDNHLDKYREIVVLGELAESFPDEESLRPTECDRGKRGNSEDRLVLPTFTHDEFGIVPTLMQVGYRCRDPITRRRGSALLERSKRRESVWDAQLNAKGVMLCAEVEERCARGPNGPPITQASQIPVEHRAYRGGFEAPPEGSGGADKIVFALGIEGTSTSRVMAADISPDWNLDQPLNVYELDREHGIEDGLQCIQQ